MFLTVGGSPAGYGYFQVTSVADENIIPAIVKHLKDNDLYNINEAFSIQTMAIQVDTDAQVSINDRAPVLIKSTIGLSFDAVGVFSIKFKTAGVKYNICLSY